MSNISIRRTHQLDREHARGAADAIARDLHRRFDLVCEWEGDNVTFKRPGVTGRMLVGERDLTLDVKLSFLMTPLKASIEQAIRKELDSLFGKE